MTPIEIIRAVNCKVLTIKAALQMMQNQKKYRNEPPPAIPPKIAVLSEQIRQELG